MAVLDPIVEYVRQQQQADAEQAAADQFAGNVEQFYKQCGYYLTNMAALAQKYGTDALYAKLPPDVAAAVQAFLTWLQPAWAQMSSQPWPEMPTEATE